MAYPKASGMPAVSGTQVPMLYAKKLLLELYESTCLQKIANTDYEGKLANQGDTVRIRTLPEIAIKEYVKGQELEYEHLDPGYVDLLIDKGLWWGFALDDIDIKQFDYDQKVEWQQHGGERLKIALETRVFENIHGDVHAANMGATAGAKSASYNLGTTGTPLAINSSNVLDALTSCASVLDEQDAPKEGRWVVLPTWATRRIKLSDLKDASLSGDNTSPLRNGRVGMIDNMTIYQSNILDTVVDTTQCTNAIFGHPCSLTFAAQISKTESLKNPKSFGDLVRSLMVYGYKVVKPEAMGKLYITPTAEA